jgi:aldose 1-epimerase
MSQLETFGVLKDGREVRKAVLSRPGGLEVELIEFGAVVRALRAPVRGQWIDAVLGFDSVGGYEADKSFQGCIVGRCANRIDHGRFTIDGRRYQVATNEGPNTLHGGPRGFDKRLWRFEAPAADGTIAMTYTSPDGEEGFPGTVQVRASYSLPEPDTLVVAYEATTDQPTPVNLSQHLYFNLSGDWGRAVLDHQLRIAGSAVTAVRPDLIPTGELLEVAGTPFDLRTPQRIADALARSHPQLEIGGGFDHNWALDPGGGEALTLSSPETGLALHIATDQPGVQVYSGQGLSGRFVPHGAIVFEPQGYPDAVNQPNFPPVVLRPGEVYRHRSVYRFEAP